MALSKAIDFLTKVRKDSSFRDKCYKQESKQSLLEHFGFSEFEFEDALNMQLVKCQSYEEAEHYQQIKMWFSVL